MAKYIYRGKTIEVPVWAKYITDFDGEIAVSCSDRKPISWDRVNLESDIIAYRKGHQFWSDVDNGKYDVVGDIDDGDAVDESYTDIVDCAEDDFIVGDTVKLNSGGPLMTVDIVTDDCIAVIWFNDSEYTYCHHMFIKSTIHLVD